MDLTIMVMQGKLITKKNQNDILNVTNEQMLEWYTQLSKERFYTWTHWEAGKIRAPDGNWTHDPL